MSRHHSTNLYIEACRIAEAVGADEGSLRRCQLSDAWLVNEVGTSEKSQGGFPDRIFRFLLAYKVSL
jgi:hypothetical protein